jgi:hypothetical protein
VDERMGTGKEQREDGRGNEGITAGDERKGR